MGKSDVNTFIGKSINIVNIGNVAIALHTESENISVENLRRLEAVILKYISS